MHGEFESTPLQSTPVPALPGAPTLIDEAALLKSNFAVLLTGFGSGVPLSNERLQQLTRFMNAGMEEVGELPIPDNERISAGYTYFGQFISHDVSAHRFIGVPPALRLHSLYGLGPAAMTCLYQHQRDPETEYKFRNLKFLLDSYTGPGQRTVWDFQRMFNSGSRSTSGKMSGTAITADARNDQNFIISQLTVSLIRLHNYLVEYYWEANLTEDEVFKKAQFALVAMYQAAIVYDYLPAIVGQDLMDHLVAHGSSGPECKTERFLFFEAGKSLGLSEIFTRAAFRFGHSQVRQLYMVLPDRRLHLFGDDLDLRGYVRDPRRAIDWTLFFGPEAQPSKCFDHLVAAQLGRLMFLPAKGDPSLIQRNLKRSLEFPKGKVFYDSYFQMLTTLGKKDLTKQEEMLVGTTPQDFYAKIETLLRTYGDGRGLAPAETPEIDELPLWLFLLLEAKILGENGTRLGPLGGRIVAEQMLWILHKDEYSVFKEGKRYFDKSFNDGRDFFEGFSVAKMLSPVLPELIEAPDFLRNMEEPHTREVEQPGEESAAAVRTTAFSALALVGMLEYRGDEFSEVSGTEYNNFKARFADSLHKKMTVLPNGFYDLSTRTTTMQSLCQSGNLPEIGKAKKRIRVFISRKALCWHAGVTGISDADHLAHPIKGLFFSFGLSTTGNPAFVLTIRPVQQDGKIPPGHESQILRSDTSATITESEMEALTCNFIMDGFQILKDNSELTVGIAANALLPMLEVASVAANPILQFSVVTSMGSEIKPEETDAEIRNAYFFSLAVQSTISGQARYSEKNQPWPPYCYG